MVSIKTRELNKGSIKTIDRASIMIQHMKQASFKMKENTIQDRNDGNAPEGYAQDQMMDNGKIASERTVVSAYDISVNAAKKARQKKEIVEIRHRKDTLLRSRDRPAEMHSPRIKTTADAKKLADIKNKAMLQKAKHEAAAKAQVKLQNAAKRAQKDAKRTAKALAMAIKKLIEGTQALIAAIGAAGVTAIVIILICVLFGAAF